MSKVRVVYVGAPLALSGSTMVMLDILNNLDRSVYEPHLVLRPGAAIDTAPLLKEDVIIHNLRHLKRLWSRGFIADYRFKKYIVKMIRSDNPDVFIVDHRKYNYLFAKLKKKYSIKIINRIGTMMSWALENLGKYNEKERARHLLPMSDVIIVPSQLAKKDLVESIGICEKKIRVIYNALDINKLKKFSQEKLNVKMNSKIILFVGSLDSRKYPMLLLEAFKELNALNYPIELWLVGDGEQKEELKKYANFHKLEHSVKFWGKQKNPYKFYKQASIFVNTSKVDGFGIALMEATYFNLPIVYADTLVGAKELLQKYKIGYPFDVNNKYDLIENIKKALDQPKKDYFDLLKSDISIGSFISKVEKVIDDIIES